MGALHKAVTLAVPVMNLGKAANVFGLHEEARVVHGQRLEDFLLEEVAEALARQTLHDIALNIDRDRIRPAFARLEKQRNVRDFGDQVVEIG